MPLPLQLHITPQKIGSLLCISALTLLPLTGCSKKDEEVVKEVVRPAKIMTIQQGSSAKTSRYPGKVQALDRVEVAFEVAGKLVKLPIKEGQHINKGDIIARLDSSDYKNRWNAAQAKVNQAKAELERYANLLAEKVVAKSTYDIKKRNYEVSLSDMKIARKAVQDTDLRAPFTGIIGKKFIDNFQVVQAKQPIVSIQKLSGIDIIVNAPEQVIGQGKKYNMEILAEFANYPGEKYPIKIKEFSTEADPQTQTYRVVLTMPIPKGKSILDGMSATVYVLLHPKGDTVTTLKIPVQSVFYDKAKTAYVWKLDEQLVAHKQPVEIGMMNGNNIVIKAGLATDDKIITAGVQNLTEGTKVREYTGTMGE